MTFRIDDPGVLVSFYKKKEQSLLIEINNLNKKLFPLTKKSSLIIYDTDKCLDRNPIHKSSECYKFKETIIQIKNKIGKLRYTTNFKNQNISDSLALIELIKLQIKILKDEGEKQYTHLSSEEEALSCINQLRDVYLNEQIKLGTNPASQEKKLFPKTARIISKIEKAPITLGSFRHCWNPKDHQIFLKIHSGNFSEEQKISKLCLSLSHIPKEDIIEHNKKHSLYLKRSQTIRNKVKEWKSKARNKIDSTSVPEKEIKKEESKPQILSKRRKQKKIQLKEWKERKKVADNVQTAKNKLHERQVKHIAKSSAYTKQEREILKQKLEEYKKNILEKRNAQNKHEIYLNSTSTKNKNDTKEKMFKYKKKDNDFIMLRKQRIDNANMKQKRALPQIKKTVVLPLSLENYKKPTTSSLCHKITNKNKNSNGVPISVDCIPKKAIPMWRSLAIELKASTKKKNDDKNKLLRLDRLVQEELPSVIKEREEAHIVKDELVDIMKWKLLRGKWRPRLVQFVESNSAELVKKSSLQAIQLAQENNVEAAVKKLCELKGVGPATASAVLSICVPDKCAFFADEIAEPFFKSKLLYNLEEYLTLNRELAQIAESIKEDEELELNPHQTELALWTFHHIKNDSKLMEELEYSSSS